MELSNQLDALATRTQAESSSEYASAVGATEEAIRHARLVETALREGQKFPSFSLPSATGGLVSSVDLLARGPLIVVFYRGGWCPACNLVLNALQLALPEIQARGGALVAVSPEVPEHTSNTMKRFGLSFFLLSDRQNVLAEKVGLVYQLPEAMRVELAKANILLPAINGDDSWKLPLPATYLVGQDGVIREAFIDTDYYRRKDPKELIAELEKLSS